MTILAQIDKVSPSFLHQAALLFVAVLAGAASVAAILGTFMRKKRELYPQPLEVRGTTEYVTANMCSTQHGEIDRRLNDHTHQLETLWTTMREEDEKTRSELRRCFQDIERSLGRIEGKLNT
jgi:hypothetical protein